MDVYKQYDLKHYTINSIAGNNNGTDYSQFFVTDFVTGHSFIPPSALRQANTLCHSKFCTECNLVFPLSTYSIVHFLKFIR